MDIVTLVFLFIALLTYLGYKVYRFLSSGEVSLCCRSDNCPWKDRCRNTIK